MQVGNRESGGCCCCGIGEGHVAGGALLALRPLPVVSGDRGLVGDYGFVAAEGCPGDVPFESGGGQGNCRVIVHCGCDVFEVVVEDLSFHGGTGTSTGVVCVDHIRGTCYFVGMQVGSDLC